MDLIEALYGNWVEVMAQSLGKKKIFIDRRFSKNLIDEQLKIDVESVEVYREAFIKRSGTAEKNSWLIFSEYFKRKFN